jgi:replicative DNA helicase
MIIVAARPAMGKSTIGLDIARNVSDRLQLPSIFFSLEMGHDELTMRQLSAEAKVSLHRMRSGTTTEDDWDRLSKYTGPVSESLIHVDDDPSLTLMQIRTKARRHKRKHGLSLIVVDYLQLLHSGTGNSRQTRQEEVSEMSRGLKLLAKELEVPLIAIAQLNRGPEGRADKKPMMSDLRESGSLEQDADVVILLHREAAYEPESPRAGEADLIVAKHRNGPTGTITVAFQGHYSRFVNMGDA